MRKVLVKVLKGLSGTYVAAIMVGVSMGMSMSEWINNHILDALLEGHYDIRVEKK